MNRQLGTPTARQLKDVEGVALGRSLLESSAFNESFRIPCGGLSYEN
jgi:hypothetical protein